MVRKLAQATGATDWSVTEDAKVSTGRVVLYLAFAMVAAALFWTGFRVTIGGQPYSEMQGWMSDVVSGAKWFIAPYTVGAARDAIASARGTGEPAT